MQIGEATYNLVKDRTECESRGMIDVKGKGQIETWIVS
jgi:hypothetical protein